MDDNKHMDRLGLAGALSSAVPRRWTGHSLGGSEPFPVCQPPDVRTGPSFEVRFSRPTAFAFPPSGGEPTGTSGVKRGNFSVACAQASVVARPALLLELRQTWNLKQLSIGDLSTTVGLAPGEKLTIEVTTSQRKRLEQSTLDTVEEIESSESTTADKEALNVTRASSKTENWRVDGRGGFSLGFLSLGASGAYSKTLSESAMQSLQQVHEATRRSAQTLKTLHKIEVKGTTETFVKNRMTRMVENPYRDRTLAVNVFQLIKHYAVETRLSEVRFAYVIGVDGIAFDEAFVLGAASFLREELLEPSLIDDLELALKAASPQPLREQNAVAIALAGQALELLFETPGLFNVPPVPRAVGDPNDPGTSFDASLTAIPPDPQRSLGNRSALSDAIDNDAALVYTTLGVYSRAWQDAKERLERRTGVWQAVVPQDAALHPFVQLATSLATAVSPVWTMLDPKTNAVKNLLAGDDFSEVLRRVSGFLALVSGALQPLLASAAAETMAHAEWQRARLPLMRLVRHLQCNERHYVRRYLETLATRTQNQALVDLAESVIGRDNAIARFIDLERSYLDGRNVVVPGIAPLEDETLDRLSGALGMKDGALGQLTAVVHDDLQVPADGVHLEVAAGACVLADVPAPLAPVQVACS